MSTTQAIRFEIQSSLLEHAQDPYHDSEPALFKYGVTQMPFRILLRFLIETGYCQFHSSARYMDFGGRYSLF